MDIKMPIAFERPRVQSVLMPKTLSDQQQIQWLKDHKYKTKFSNKKRPHETEDFFRYRQFNPQKQESDYRTVILDKDLNIKGIVEFSDDFKHIPKRVFKKKDTETVLPKKEL